MADLTVCSFLTKVLCAHGGRMFLQDLRGHVELSEAKLRAVLRRAGPERFLLQEVELRDGPWDAEAEVAAGAGAGAGGGGGGASACRVVAVSSVRLCARYQRGECQACDQLHLCRRHMLGKCPHRDCWSMCSLSHDIHTPINIQVLKNHGIFGLNEAQLRILLLQNDPCLLPEVCLLYNKGGDPLYGYCNLKDKCTKFHVCKSFVRGECTLQTCKRSHQLIHAATLKLLEDQELSIPSVVNFQIISAYRHTKLHKMLEDKGNSASAEHSQGLEKQGTHAAGAVEARPLVPAPAQMPRKPCPEQLHSTQGTGLEEEPS